MIIVNYILGLLVGIFGGVIFLCLVLAYVDCMDKAFKMEGKFIKNVYKSFLNYPKTFYKMFINGIKILLPFIVLLLAILMSLTFYKWLEPLMLM